MDNLSSQKRSMSYKLSFVAVLLAFTVVLLGAYTRLVDAGLGCPDWPGCYGFLTVPEKAIDVQTAAEAFPNTPLEAHKAWPEMIHRYFAGSLGLLVAALAVIGFVNRNKNEQPLLLSYSLLGIIIFQAALGMWTVTMGLLPIIVMGHLLGGFITLTLLLILFLNIRHDNPVAWASPVRSAALIGVLIVFVQIILGGWTSANYAAIICADFPTCQGAMIPPLDFSGAFTISTEGVSSYLGGHLDNASRVTIQWMHRVGALITTVYMLYLITKLFLNGWKKFSLWLSAVLIAQVSLGISNVVFSLPLAVAVAHNGVAVLLLMSLATLVHYSGLKR
ncbi:Heme A synthase, cytochrome oxidase biogenesis protein Cox15-CtaA [hydrothermal vent metagenome]|uniref:Heme A synthase, cytochrome oxidase biogenesis protein Cox15-CtaA n=1 Tax=hydrothermal vent metagenome TaxID=652676 RepID=A0A3B0W755_9ZZZZ